MSDRRSFVAWLGSLPLVGRHLPLRAAPPIVIDAMPTALYQQPDGRNNLVQVAVSGLDAPAGRARVTDRRGTLVGTAGLLATGAGLAGELWVPLSRASGAEFQIDVEVGKQRVGSRRVRLTPPRRWTVYWIASSHTDVRLTALQEDSVELHRRNLDAALARLPAHPDFRWTAECALHLISYVENRAPAAGEALARAIRDGKIGVSALFAQPLTGILDHETFARLERLVVEDPRQRLREQRRDADLAVADGACERLPRGGRAVLDVRDQVERALRRPAEVGMGGQPGQRRIQIPAVQFDTVFLKRGEADVGVARRDPVDGPAARWREPDAATPDPLLADLDVDLELGPGGPGEGHPELAGEARAGGQAARGPYQRAAAVGHAGASRRGVEARHGDLDEVVAAIGLLVQRRGHSVDHNRGCGAQGEV